jgi:hypothetical protein
MALPTTKLFLDRCTTNRGKNQVKIRRSGRNGFKQNFLLERRLYFKLAEIDFQTPQVGVRTTTYQVGRLNRSKAVIVTSNT